MDARDEMEPQGHPPYAEVSDNSSSSLDKQVQAPAAQHLEAIRTISRVPGNDHYYEKDGLRTYGDSPDEDHLHEPPVSCEISPQSMATANSEYR